MSASPSPGRVALRGFALPALLLLAAGCTPAGDAAAGAQLQDDADDGEQRVPDEGASYYVDQHVERLNEGRNVLREGYLAQLETCRASGAPVDALPEDDVAKIGTERWRMWRDGRRFAYRTETWHVDQPDNPTRETMCAFSLELGGLHGYADASRSVTIELGPGGERTEAEGDPHSGLYRVEGANHPEDIQGARQQGMQGPVRQSVAGQPCDRWQTPRGGSVCIWAGGTRWGIGSVGDGEFLASDGADPDYIVLEATPPPGGMGDRIETRAMVVGAPLDETEMMPGAR